VAACRWRRAACGSQCAESTTRNARRTTHAGFTLIELLVVTAVISILLALMLPVLHRARIVAYRVTCGSHLRQIATAWHAYLGDNNQQFYQAPNANHYFGGWEGIAGGPVRRPLNPYAGLPPAPQTQRDAGLFRCRADKGDDNLGLAAYRYFGNSYQTNLMLIGRDSLPTWMDEPIKTLNRRINEHLKSLKAGAVCDPARLLLVGDNYWVRQWEPLTDTAAASWHGAVGRYNLAYLDGHVALIEIHKGVYIDSDYRIQPFKELDSLTLEVQSRIAEQAGGVPQAGP
jgi:prepilin-type N-terminal cleavage/methylation domain-containing protein/prepilin-type processing-associated H-X9-DG protein